VLDVNNGARFSTYSIEGEANSGIIGVNGAAARLVSKGDIVIILSYCQVPEDDAVNTVPRIVRVDSRNRVVEPLPTVPQWEKIRKSLASSGEL
jgi:aspartate 1-decarboxylase